jgi:hypothetical protein
VFPTGVSNVALKKSAIPAEWHLQVSFSPARGRGSKLAITDYRGSNLELTIPCETYAIALLGKKSHSSSC